MDEKRLEVHFTMVDSSFIGIVYPQTGQQIITHFLCKGQWEQPGWSPGINWCLHIGQMTEFSLINPILLPGELS
jgi:hypothetical protein